MMAKKIATLLFLKIFLVTLHVHRIAATSPALYVFGDSTADVGNNNFLPDDAPKANFPPYGIDYPGRIPTGRFSNGFNGVDYIAKEVGLAVSPPPFLSVTGGMQMGRGVNFASAGSGILDNTGQDVISMAAQIEDFETVADNLTARMGDQPASVFLAKSLFFFSVGSNDLFAQLSLLSSINDAQKDQIVALIINKFKDQLKMLYDLGARKYAVVGTGLIGCIPAMRVLNASGDCNEGLNDLSLRFKDATRALLNDLSMSLDGFIYSFGDAYELGTQVNDKPLLFGFRETKDACCGAGTLKAETACGPNSVYCSNRNQYLFWDLIHPTQALYKLSAEVSLYGPPQFANPINIHQLVIG